MTHQDKHSYHYLDLRKQVFMECGAMAKYALEKGFDVPAKTIQQIEAFEVTNNEEYCQSEINRNLDITPLIEIHQLLVRLIKPATPQTVLLIDIERQTVNAFKFLGPVALIRQFMVAAIISFLLFFGLMSSEYISAESLQKNFMEASGLDQFIQLIFLIGAAGLGASFEALYRVNKYISNGTYDPCYHISYWMRFSMGIISGLLMSVLISQNSLESQNLLSNGIIRPLLAILGGFSADLLYTTINKLIETFKLLINNSASNLLLAKEQEDKVNSSVQEFKNRMKLAEELMSLHQKVGLDTENSEQVKKQLNKIMNNLVNGEFGS